MDGFVIAPLKNRAPDNDATGAFHIGARALTRIHSLPRPPVFFENEGSAMSVYKGFSKAVDEAPAPNGWDFFAYFGHGESWGLVSAYISKREGALELCRRIIPKANDGIKVMLYACNCGDPGGFASWMAEGLAPVNGEVFAHLSPPGHTFTNPMVVSYDKNSGRTPTWVIPRSHPQWRAWCHHLKDEHGEMFARFPFMEQDELEGELEAPKFLLGRWKVTGKDDSWDVVFFPDKTVAGTDPFNRYQINGSGRWTATTQNLTITWDNGDTERWPLALSLRNQNVYYKGSGGAAQHYRATRTEYPEMNPQMMFRTRMQMSRLIDI